MEITENYGKIDDKIIEEYYQKLRNGEDYRNTNPICRTNVNESCIKTFNRLKENDIYLIHEIKITYYYVGESRQYYYPGIDDDYIYIDNYGRMLKLNSTSGFTDCSVKGMNCLTERNYTNYTKKLSNKLIKQIKSIINYNHLSIVKGQGVYNHIYDQIKCIIENEESTFNKESNNEIINLQNKIKELENQQEDNIEELLNKDKHFFIEDEKKEPLKNTELEKENTDLKSKIKEQNDLIQKLLDKIYDLKEELFEKKSC
jgi:hypothetical protein